MPPIHGITFDLDDTLWCGTSVIARASEAFHGFLNERVPLLGGRFPMDAFNTEMLQLRRELPCRAHDFTFLRKETLRRCIERTGRHDLELEDETKLKAFVDEAFSVFLKARSQPQLFDGVEELLEQLAKELTLVASSSSSPCDESADNDDVHHRHQVQDTTVHGQTQQLVEPKADHKPQEVVCMGVITNGNCCFDYLPPTLQQKLQFVVSAEQVGKAKPDAEVFECALQQFPSHLRRQPHHFVHVGDHYECDIVGAKAAGLRTIWINLNDPDDESSSNGSGCRDNGDDVVFREDMTDAQRERYGAADAIVRHVTQVYQVVQRWTQDRAIIA